MLAEYKSKVNKGVGFGLLSGFIAGIIGSIEGWAAIGQILAVVSYGLIVWGAIQYAKGKGQSPWFGLLGLLYILGFILLVLLPDRYK